MPKVPLIQVTQPVTPPAGPGKLLSIRIVGGGDYDQSGSHENGAVMQARVGDVLVVPGRKTRTGLIVRIVGKNGAPPYVIKWLADGHIAMVTPGEYSRIVPASDGHASGE